MPEQFDLFRTPKKIEDKIISPQSAEETAYEPTDADKQAEISAFENGGKPIKLIEPRDNKKAFEKFKQDWRKLLEEPGLQTDLPLDNAGNSPKE